MISNLIGMDVWFEDELCEIVAADCETPDCSMRFHIVLGSGEIKAIPAEGAIIDLDDEEEQEEEEE